MQFRKSILFLSLIGLMVLPSSAFAQCTEWSPCQYGDFRYWVSNGTVIISEYIGSGGAVVIPSAIDGKPVVCIGDYALSPCRACTGLTSVTIPNSVTRIGNNAFTDARNLTSVAIPNSVTSIGDNAFTFCIVLTSVAIGNCVASIGDGAFSYCPNLTSIVVGASNATYSSQDGVLYNKAKTELIQYPGGKSGGITIPNGVTRIKDNAFARCSGLTSVTLGNSVASIGDGAFKYCSGLTSVTIGNSVTSIGYEAFKYCSGLTSVTIPNSVTSIGDWAFSDCTRLAIITIPDSVTSIERFAFAGCSGLTRAYFNGNAPSMGRKVFYGCSDIFSICYTAGATGFTSPTWVYYNSGGIMCSCPAAVCASTTTVPVNQ